jgi:hypothetical protein
MKSCDITARLRWLSPAYVGTTYYVLSTTTNTIMGGGKAIIGLSL